MTIGNDILVLQGTSLGIVNEGAGNDRYVLDGSVLNANQKITISDVEGFNTLALTGGLVITSSRVANNAVELTLNNGAVVTVLGASNFNFQTGGNPITGTGGTTQTFSNFVTLSLGVAAGVPAASAGLVTVSTPVTVSATGGTGAVTPGAYTLTSSSDTVVEGSTLTFTVTRTGDLTAAKTLAFNATGDTNGGTVTAATPGTDASPASGTVTFAAGSATTTFGVIASADLEVEGLEGLKITLLDGLTAVGSKVVLINDDPTANQTFVLTTAAASVNEGGTAVFTLTTTNVPAGTAVNYAIVGTNAALGATTTGTMTVDATGKATVSVPVAANTVLGDSGTLVLTLVNKPAVTATVAVADVTVDPVLEAASTAAAAAAATALTAATDAVTAETAAITKAALTDAPALAAAATAAATAATAATAASTAAIAAQAAAQTAFDNSTPANFATNGVALNAAKADAVTKLAAATSAIAAETAATTASTAAAADDTAATTAIAAAATATAAATTAAAAFVTAAAATGSTADDALAAAAVTAAAVPATAHAQIGLTAAYNTAKAAADVAIVAATTATTLADTTAATATAAVATNVTTPTAANLAAILTAKTAADAAATAAVTANTAAAAKVTAATTAAAATTVTTDDAATAAQKLVVDALVAKVVADQAANTKTGADYAALIQPGQTITLTTDANNGAAFTGTANADTFNAPIGIVFNAGLAVNTDTMQSADVLKGGGGIDTLNFTTIGTGGTPVLPTLESIEIINGTSLAGMTLSTTAVAGLTNLNVIKAAGAVALTAAASTDVSVAMKAAGAAVGVVGGNNVTVNLTDVAANLDAVTIGTGTNPVGDVSVAMTGKAYVATALPATLSAVTVNGGKTISVTQKAAADVAAAASDTFIVTLTQGDIAATANADTTTVTIKQDAAVTAVNAANTTGGVTETASVKFSALTLGQTIIMGGLTFTAPAALTAAQAASSFASLVNGAAYGALVPAGDTQGSGLASNGTYTGVFTGWTSSAAVGDTVMFTSTTPNDGTVALVKTGTGTAVVTTTEGKANDATATGGVMGVVAGKVTVANGTALKAVTIDGYSTAASAITGGNTVMETLNLSNGGAFIMSNSAATLALNLEKVNGVFTATAGAATLNVKSVGANTAGLAAAGTTALNVSGTGQLNASTGSTLAAVKTIVVTETAGLILGGTVMTALESVTTTGTTGTVMVALSGQKATYTGGAGMDMVTVTDAGIAATKAIDLGAGNDKLTLVGAPVLAPTVEFKGGLGNDTLSLDAASAALLGAAFAGKVSGFEALEITGANGPQTVDTAALGNYNDITVTAGNALAATLTLDKLTSGATIRLNDAANSGVGTNSLDAIVANIKDAATNLTDVLNLAISATVAADATADAHGTLTAANVETINVAVLNASTAARDAQTLTLTADKATLVNVTGDTALTLTLTGSNKVATVTSTSSGALTLDLSAHNGVLMTVTGGSGNDVLAASVGATAKSDVLIGGAGNDTLVAGTNSAMLTGGAGNDLFVVHAGSATLGNKEANTYSSITDFQAGDLLKLSHFNATELVTTSFAKLTAVLNPATAVYSDYVGAAIAQALLGQSVWFKIGSDSYVVTDSGVESALTFVNTEDLVVKLVGVDLANASFNATSGTVALV